MANQERIDSAFDVAAIQAEAKSVLKSIDEVSARIKQNAADLSQLGATLQSGKTSGAGAAGGMLSQQQADIKQLIALNNQLAAANAKLETSTWDESKALVALNVQLAENRKAATAVAQAANADYQARQQAAAAAKEEATARKQAAQNAREEARINAELSSAYTLLSKAYNDAKKKYQDYAAELGQGHAVTIAAQRDTQRLYTQLNNIDKGAGDFRRNVGNYASGFNGLNVSIQQILREAPSAAVSLNTFFLAISNNIPMFIDEVNKLTLANKEAAAAAAAMGQEVGKQTSVFKSVIKSLLSFQSVLSVGVLLLTLYGKDVIEFTTSLFKGGLASDKAAASFGILNKAYTDSSVKTAIENVERLTIEIDLAKKGFIEKTKVLKDYNETIGKTVGEAKDLNEAEMALSKNAENYIRFTLLKSAATTAFQKSAEETVNSQLAASKAVKDLSSVGPIDVTGAISAAIQAKKAETAKEDSKTLLDIGKDYYKQAAQMAKDNKFDFFGGKEDPKKGKAPQDLTSETLAAKQKELEEQKKIDEAIYLESQQSFENIFKDETKSQDQRSAALSAFQANRLISIKSGADAERKEVQLKLSKIAEIENKDASKRTNEENVLLLNKKNLQLSLQRIQVERTKQINDITADGETKNTEIITSESKKQYNIIVGSLNDISAEGRKNGLNDIDIWTKQKEYLSDSLNNIELDAKDRQKLQEGIVDITDKTEKKINEITKGSIKTKQDAYKQLYDVIKQGAQEVAHLLENVFTASLKRQQDSLSAANDQIDSNKNKQVDAINASALSEEDKQKRIAVAEAEATSQREANERKINALKEEQAKITKAINVATIIGANIATIAQLRAKLAEATAQLAILTASALANPLLAPAAAAMGAAVGVISGTIVATAAIGAAQVAAALAVPAYDKGKDPSDPYTGPAIMGECRPELLIRKDGSAMFADKPTIFKTYAGDRVFSNDELKNGAAMSYMIGSDSDKTQKELLGEMREMNHRLSRQRTPVINIYANTSFDKRVNNARA